jgi:NAD(P)H dehydrogenase (quinone)
MRCRFAQIHADFCFICVLLEWPMKVSVILGHPSQGSFNHAIAETVVETLRRSGHTVRYHDLYAEGFDPITTHAEVPKGAPLDPAIRHHCDEIARADGIVIVHPNWWGQPPAILKGWIDRVLRVGVAYEFEEGDPLENLWKTCVFDLCGVRTFCRRMYCVIVTSTLEQQRRAWLEDVARVIQECFG